MAEVKKCPRDQSKRPDKPLYVPRPLRKMEVYKMERSIETNLSKNKDSPKHRKTFSDESTVHLNQIIDSDRKLLASSSKFESNMCKNIESKIQKINSEKYKQRECAFEIEKSHFSAQDIIKSENSINSEFKNKLKGRKNINDTDVEMCKRSLKNSTNHTKETKSCNFLKKISSEYLVDVSAKVKGESKSMSSINDTVIPKCKDIKIPFKSIDSYLSSKSLVHLTDAALFTQTKTERITKNSGHDDYLSKEAEKPISINVTNTSLGKYSHFDKITSYGHDSNAVRVKIGNDIQPVTVSVHSKKYDAKSQGNAFVLDNSWEERFNDDGECLDLKFHEQLSDDTKQMEVKNEDSDSQPLFKNSSMEYSNIVELYGFPMNFNTQDLTSAFSTFQEATYVIKWVDDSHALAIFSSSVIANQALLLCHPLIKMRPLFEGTEESKRKAKHCATLLDTSKVRPATSAVFARRLVTGALGLKVPISKEQREQEKQLLSEAKEKKRSKAKKKEDIWNGISN